MPGCIPRIFRCTKFRSAGLEDRPWTLFALTGHRRLRTPGQDLRARQGRDGHEHLPWSYTTCITRASIRTDHGAAMPAPSAGIPVLATLRQRFSGSPRHNLSGDQPVP